LSIPAPIVCFHVIDWTFWLAAEELDASNVIAADADEAAPIRTRKQNDTTRTSASSDRDSAGLQAFPGTHAIPFTSTSFSAAIPAERRTRVTAA